MDNYPHFVIKESEFSKNQRFVGFYMPDEEVNKLIKMFPEGCKHSNYFGEYDIPFKDGQSVSEYFNSIRKNLTQEQINNFYSEIDKLEKKNQGLIWQWSDLLHAGLWPIFDNSLRLACGKGKIKANKHTIIIMLDKVPDRVLKLWKELLNDHIIPMQEIAKRL